MGYAALLCVVATLATAPAASASRRCSFAGAGFPSVQNLRTAGVGCSTGREVAFEIQGAVEDAGKLPRRVQPRPRQFYACRYKERRVRGEQGDTYLRAVCRRGRSRLVTMDLYS